MEAREIIPATASPLLLKKSELVCVFFFKCKATLLNGYYVSVRVNKSPYYGFNGTINNSELKRKAW